MSVGVGVGVGVFVGVLVGVGVRVAGELGLPVRYIGVGEGLDDLRQFNSRDFAAAVLG